MQKIHSNDFSFILLYMSGNPAFRPVLGLLKSAVCYNAVLNLHESAFSSALLVSYQKSHFIDLSLVLC